MDHLTRRAIDVAGGSGQLRKISVLKSPSAADLAAAADEIGTAPVTPTDVSGFGSSRKIKKKKHSQMEQQKMVFTFAVTNDYLFIYKIIKKKTVLLSI